MYMYTFRRIEVTSFCSEAAIVIQIETKNQINF